MRLQAHTPHIRPRCLYKTVIRLYKKAVDMDTRIKRHLIEVIQVSIVPDEEYPEPEEKPNADSKQDGE